MNTPAVQFLNQYSWLLVCAALLVGSALYLRLRQASRRWWGVWGLFALANAGMLMLLPTPAARLSEYQPAVWHEGGRYPININDRVTTGYTFNRSLQFSSVAEIEAALLSTKGRPTLVEFYSDFGIL